MFANLVFMINCESSDQGVIVAGKVVAFSKSRATDIASIADNI